MQKAIWTKNLPTRTIALLKPLQTELERAQQIRRLLRHDQKPASCGAQANNRSVYLLRSLCIGSDVLDQPLQFSQTDGYSVHGTGLRNVRRTKTLPARTIAELPRTASTRPEHFLEGVPGPVRKAKQFVRSAGRLRWLIQLRCFVLARINKQVSVKFTTPGQKRST